MDKIIKLAALLRQAQDVIEEIKADSKATGYEVISADVNACTRNDITVHVYGDLGRFEVPLTVKDFGDADGEFEESVTLGGVKFSALMRKYDAELAF